MKKIAILLLMALMAVMAQTALAQGSGNCGTGWEYKDESAPFEYSGDKIIDKVIVKASTECFSFKYAGSGMVSSACYVVQGLGTSHVKVVNAPTAPEECHDISHVEFYADPNTATPTNPGPVDTPTNTATLETPFKFWTFTPTATEATQTPTSTGTIAAPPEETYTPTPPDTLPPPPPRKTKTPVVLLPETGQSGNNDGDGGWIGVASFAVVMAYLAFRAYLRRRE